MWYTITSEELIDNEKRKKYKYEEQDNKQHEEKDNLQHDEKDNNKMKRKSKKNIDASEEKVQDDTYTIEKNTAKGKGKKSAN